jgi:hypothetical protein
MEKHHEYYAAVEADQAFSDACRAAFGDPAGHWGISYYDLPNSVKSAYLRKRMADRRLIRATRNRRNEDNA